jgi:hypothetical protein
VHILSIPTVVSKACLLYRISMVKQNPHPIRQHTTIHAGFFMLAMLELSSSRQ